MSYDMNITNEHLNCTYNVSKMFYAHNPKGIRLHYGLTGKDALEPLLSLYLFMLKNPERLKLLNPTNNWGSYEQATDFVHKLIMASIENPDDTWEGD